MMPERRKKKGRDMMMPLLLPLLLSLLSLWRSANALPQQHDANTTILATVVLAGANKYSLKLGEASSSLPGAVAWGSFANTLNTTGWGELNIRTSGRFSDTQQHAAAGFLEGALTAEHIFTTYLNTMEFTFHGEPVPASVTGFMAAQEEWAREQVESSASDPFWQHVGALLAQYDGMIAGYASSKAPAVNPFAWQLLNGVGDLFQIIPAVEKHQRVDWPSLSRDEARAALLKAGHCSALVKVVGDLSELFMGHSSWFEYANTNRIFKSYHFDFHAPAGANRISFSSYPGYLESLDDFYMMDSGLGMVQTSNEVADNTLLDLITPRSLLAWQRVRVASAMASTGEEWWSAFKTHASGTYVNQYMVVDFKLFSKGKALVPNTLWVIEEIPGLVKGGDQTATLARGYWPSYNVPYYAEVYNRSGYKQLFDDDDDSAAAAILGAAGTPSPPPPMTAPGYDGGGSEYTIGAPRSKIFRRDEGKVVDLQSFKNILRYANYTDPYAISAETGKVNYGCALCMRGDLGGNGTAGAGGCYDTKVTSSTLFANMSCHAVSGPSSMASSTESVLPPFSWRPTIDDKTLHLGLPQTYNFPFVPITAAEL